MSKRLATLTAAALVLAGCGSADDLKARWLVLPEAATAEIHDGPGLNQIQSLDLKNLVVNMGEVAAYVPLAEDLYSESGEVFDPVRGYVMEFDGGTASADLPGGHSLEWSFDEADMYFSDANGDGSQDVLLTLNQTIVTDGDSAQSVAILTGLYGNAEVTNLALVDVQPQVTSVSAIEGGWSYTTEIETVQLGYPADKPVIIDEFGGAMGCPRNMSVIEAAMEGEPKKAESLLNAEGGDAIAGFEEDGTYFLTEGRFETTEPMALFLLDGGDHTRASDWRCGWEAR